VRVTPISLEVYNLEKGAEMSLDMYLDKRTYIDGAGNKLNITGINNKVDVSRIKYLTEKVAVWRKANAIHWWFVMNVQDGEDDNRQYPVAAGQLNSLLKLCKQVQEEPESASKWLPTQEGFLFGSTEYDSQYFQKISYTIDVLEAELKEGPDQRQEYLYQSDW
jgi:hypothetical protein